MSAEAKHTPGPWHRDKTSGGRCDVRAENGRKVALCWGLSTTKAAQVNSPAYRAECDANAHLIAAAPELLEALEALMAEYIADNPQSDGADNPDCSVAMMAAYAAIRRATGAT